MSANLVTRCPECATSFRVLPAQLSARGGRVRCGKCSRVFDGLANLVQDAPPPAADEPSPQIGLFDPRGRPTAEASASAAAPESADATQHASEPGSGGTFAAGSDAIGDDEPLPEFLEDRLPRRPFRLVWGLLSLLAVTLLAAQTVFHYRTEIAALFPETRPHLEIACEMLDCELRLPRRADLLSIDSSDLQADARRANVLVLNAVVRNRAPFPQEYPSLELTLTDERDELVVRRVLTPADYLAERRTAARGLAAGGEESLRLYIEAAKVRATGYRLYLFFP
jgi:predicted Zn finger-like uncharacterized protein